MSTLKEQEQTINELKVERAEEWKKGKDNRDDDKISSLNDEINELKSEVKKEY